MKNSLLSLFGLFVMITMGVQADAGTIPDIRDVSYKDKISSEPVLVQVINIPDISSESARDAVTRAAMGRKWSIEKLENGDIQTKLLHRSFDSTLTFKVKDGSIEVWSVSYEIKKKTQVRVKRDEPSGWIRNLHKDILTLLRLL